MQFYTRRDYHDDQDTLGKMVRQWVWTARLPAVLIQMI